MTKQEVNHVYEQSIFEIRLRVAISLLACPGITQEQALVEADKFVRLLLSEDADELVHHHFK